MTERECLFEKVRVEAQKRLTKLAQRRDEFKPLVEEWRDSEFSEFEPEVTEYNLSFSAVVESKREISGVVRWFTARGFRVVYVGRPSQYSTAWFYHLQKRSDPEGEWITLTVSPKSCRLEPTGETREVPVMQVVCE